MSRSRSILIGSLIAALYAGTASADTLREALNMTYRTNPTLMAQREALRATDAAVAIARAGGRPQINATAGLNRDLARSGVLDVGGNGPAHLGGDRFAIDNLRTCHENLLSSPCAASDSGHRPACLPASPAASPHRL